MSRNIKKSMGFSLHWGHEVSQWRPNLFIFTLSEANVLRHTTHCGISSLPTIVLVKPRARYASSYFLVVFLVVLTFGVDSSCTLRLAVHGLHALMIKKHIISLILASAEALCSPPILTPVSPKYLICSDWSAHTHLSQHCSLCLWSALSCF